MLFINLLIVTAMNFSAHAEKVDVNIKDIDTKQSDGAIVIRKEPITGSPTNPQFQITDGDEEIIADSDPLLKQARLNWKKSCADWKAEMKSNNKDSHIISLNCGSMNCTTATMESTCKSKATYKIKVKTVQ